MRQDEPEATEEPVRPGVPVCLVTGFLGAGKTTLLNHILRNRCGLRAAVFVNEFGAMEIDGSLIRWQGAIDEARVITLDNGCICCEVNADLAKQLRSVLHSSSEAGQGLDFIVIETSGICNPGPVLATLEIIDGLAFSTHLDSVLAVVDASTFDEEAAGPRAAAVIGLSETARAQIAHSDLVLLNKCDLIGGSCSERADRVEAALKSGPARLCGARIIRTEGAEVDLALITSLPRAAASGGPEGEPPSKRPRRPPVPGEEEAVAAAPLCKEAATGKPAVAGLHARVALRAQARSFVYTSVRPFDPLKFELWVEQGGPPASVVRAKGLLWMRGVPRHVVFQLAGPRTNPFETVAGGGAPTGSRIVFIGEASSLRRGDEAAVITALNACLG